MKHLIPLFLLACQPEPKLVEPVPVVIVVEQYGDIERVYIKNNGVECWIFYDGEFIGRERY